MQTLTQHAEAFALMSKFGKSRDGMGLYADHYHFYANADPADFSEANLKRLDELGWYAGEDDAGEPAFFNIR